MILLACRGRPELNNNSNTVKYLALLSRWPVLRENEAEGFRLVLDAPSIQSYVQEQKEPIGVIYEDKFVIILRDLLENRAREKFGYIRILNKSLLFGHSGVVVLPLATPPGADEGVLLIRTFRHALRGWTLELPRGFGEPDLDGPASARKELLEETGYEANEVDLLGTIQPDSGLLNSRAEVYIARVSENSKAEPHPEQTELIDEVILCSMREMDSFIAAGKIQDGYTLSALTLAKARGFLR